ncbi:GAF domain-containing protein [Tahibacter aquaticus]|uniref:GAF domain-containing protein n=1 Tax=Tahibacter aquaticus TaxID=520092 RepID=A0A4R6YU71_9GAMM|nr:GAF domain-containing protein [Tahibacter aquaticus]TDR42003.1 GAF domain-containing protein [Tahibacter aquaticus]
MPAQLDEPARQRALDTYRVVDSLPEAAYHDIVSLASTLCNTPIALVSLVDRERQWFKASHGLGATGTRRDEAFCNYAIDAPTQLMEVPDARGDTRFAGNPLVTGDLSIRFYAGMPLVTEAGAAIGTVCVLDNKPRELDARQRAGLQALARLTMTLLDARLHEQQLERAVLLAEATHVDKAAVADAAGYTVAIFQVQDLAGHALRIGERALDRQLQDLARQLHDVLPAGGGDSVNHTTHSPDFIAVLHGEQATATEQALRAKADEFTARSGIQVVSGSARARTAADRIETVFMRADEALTQAKSAAV